MVASVTVLLPPPRPDSVPAPEITPPLATVTVLARTSALAPLKSISPVALTASVPISANRAMSSALWPTVTVPAPLVPPTVALPKTRSALLPLTLTWPCPPAVPPTVSCPLFFTVVLLLKVPCAAPTATSLPLSSARSPVPPAPTASTLVSSALELGWPLATRSSPPSSVTEPCPLAWLPIVALKAVTWPLTPPAMPLMVREPVPASPTVSVPLFIHSPPLTVALPWLPADWPMSAPLSVTVEAIPSSDSEPMPEPPTTTVSAVICSRFTTVPLLPLFWPTTRAFCADGPVRSSAPPIRTNRPCPPWPTTTCCWAVSSAPPVSVSAPPLSTTTASPVRPWAVICPVSVVVPETSSSPTAPSPDTV